MYYLLASKPNILQLLFFTDILIIHKLCYAVVYYIRQLHRSPSIGLQYFW